MLNLKRELKVNKVKDIDYVFHFGAPLNLKRELKEDKLDRQKLNSRKLLNLKRELKVLN